MLAYSNQTANQCCFGNSKKPTVNNALSPILLAV